MKRHLLFHVGLHVFLVLCLSVPSMQRVKDGKMERQEGEKAVNELLTVNIELINILKFEPIGCGEKQEKRDSVCFFLHDFGFF